MAKEPKSVRIFRIFTVSRRQITGMTRYRTKAITKTDLKKMIAKELKRYPRNAVYETGVIGDE